MASGQGSAARPVAKRASALRDVFRGVSLSRDALVLVVSVATALLAVGAGAVAGTDTITTIAGTGSSGSSGDGGQATSAELNGPEGVATDAAGNVSIAEATGHRVCKVTPSGLITTLAGTGVLGFSGDQGAATAARLRFPLGLAVDGAGNLFIADAGNHRVRKVGPDGVITTIAGTGVAGFSGDGGPATSAQLYSPAGMAVDAGGNLYVADIGNERVRKITPTEPTPPSGGQPPGFEAQADAAVEADMIGAVATRSRLGGRVVRAELRLDERVSATLRLVRNGRTLASKRYASVRPGEQVLTLVVPRRVTKGPATLRIELADTAGNSRSFRRAVRIGRPG